MPPVCEGTFHSPLHIREEDSRAFHDAVGGFLRGELGGLDAEVGEGFVEGLSLVEEAGQFGFGVFFASEEGAVVVVGGAAGEEGGIGIEPDDVAEMAQQRKIARLSDDAAAGGDAGSALAEQGAQCGAFAKAKAGLCFGGEDGGDALTGGFDDELVGVDALEADHLRDDAGDGGFPAAHEADEDDVGLAWERCGGLVDHGLQDAAGEFGIVLDGVEVGGITRLPAAGAEFGIRDVFVTPAAFAVGIGFAGGWDGEAEKAAEIEVTIPLGDFLIVGDVVDAAEPMGDEMHEGAGGIVTDWRGNKPQLGGQIVAAANRAILDEALISLRRSAL